MTELGTRSIRTMHIDVEREHEETEKLKGQLKTELGRIGLTGSQLELVQSSAELAFDLHREDRRTYEPYINHLVRVPLRLVEFGVTDENTLAAALLHDSLEDHVEELIQKVPENELPPDEHDPRILGHTALSLLINEKVADIVRELSNPILREGEDKNASYVEHIRHLVEESSYEALEIKISDFIDNTDAHGQEDARKRKSLDFKQKNVYPIVIHALSRLEGRPTATSIPIMRQTLENAEAAAHDRLSTYATTDA